MSTFKNRLLWRLLLCGVVECCGRSSVSCEYLKSIHASRAQSSMPADVFARIRCGTSPWQAQMAVKFHCYVFGEHLWSADSFFGLSWGPWIPLYQYVSLRRTLDVWWPVCGPRFSFAALLYDFLCRSVRLLCVQICCGGWCATSGDSPAVTLLRWLWLQIQQLLDSRYR